MDTVGSVAPAATLPALPETTRHHVETPGGSARRERAVVAVLLLTVVAVIATCFWPGHMNADTLTTIGEVTQRDLGNRHAPILGALWIPLWDLGVGPGWVLSAQVAGFVVGTYLVLRMAFRPLVAGIAAALVALSPPIFGMLGLLGRDAWFIASLLLGFGLVFAVTRASGRVRWIALAAALPCIWLALASRQNAAPAVVLATIAWVAVARGASWSWSLRGIASTAGLGVLLAAAFAASQAAAVAALDVRDANPEQYLYEYDLAGISYRERVNLFPADVVKERGIDVVDRYWFVDDVLPYIVAPGAPFDQALGEPQMESLGRAWRSAIGHHPAAYFDTRWDIFWRQIGLTRAPAQIYHPGIDSNAFGFVIRFPALNDAARDYVEAFANDAYDGDFLFRAWIYVLIGTVAAAVFLLRARTTLTLAAGLFCVTALVYQSGLMLGAMGVQYRLEFPAVVTGLLGGILLAGSLWQQRRTRSASELGI